MSKGTAKSRVLMGLGVVLSLALVGLVVTFALVQIQTQQKHDEDLRVWNTTNRLVDEWLSFKQERLIASWRRELNTAKTHVVDEKLGNQSPDPLPALAAFQRMAGTRGEVLNQRVADIQTKIDQAPKVCNGQIEALRLQVADERDGRGKAMQAAGVAFTPADTADLRELSKHSYDLTVRDRLGWGMCRQWYESVYALGSAPQEVRQRLEAMAKKEIAGGPVAHYTLEDAEKAPAKETEDYSGTGY
ncbi:MAG TPA: hypothetical protein VIO59_03600 [Rhodanobacter sp.]